MSKDAEAFFGGAFVQVDSVAKDCKQLAKVKWCAHLTVAHKVGCDKGFFAIVKFYDEFGDRLDSVRERTLGVKEGALVEMTVVTDSPLAVAEAKVDSAACI